MSESKLDGERVRQLIEVKKEEQERLTIQISRLQTQLDFFKKEIKVLRDRCPHEWEKVFPEAILKTCKFCALVQ